MGTEAKTRVDGKARARRTSREERRQQIVETAVEVFGRVGYRQGSLKDVADSIGLTVPGLLHYFPSKEALLMAALDLRGSVAQPERTRVADEEGFLAAGRLILAENLASPGLMRLYITLAAEATDEDHPAHEYFVQRYAFTHEYFTERLDALVTSGVLPADTDVDVAVSQLVALMDGLQLQKLLRPDLDILHVYDRSMTALFAAHGG